ncbi:MAG: DUF5916 domain-containing protein [candidate division WOR-3 bacterium]
MGFTQPNINRFWQMNGAILPILIILIQTKPTIQAKLTSIRPKIDGQLEPIWSSGDSAKSFIQQRPKEGEPATESTTVYLLYDPENLYVAFKCYCRNLKSINRQVLLRDEYSGDRVGLLLDTFDDQNTGYYFVINAGGVQADYTVTADFRNWDKSWDGIWYSAVSLTNFGYCVEIAIPFRSIRYNPDINEWGINFTRYIAINDEQSYWSPQSRQAVRVSQSGRLIGIKPQVRGANLEIYPVALCRYEQDEKIKVKPDAGLDVSWTLGNAATFRFTTNPDFAQIEADPSQINLGKYELWYPERRPFFIEDAEIFTTPIKYFYSRRIGRPLPNGKPVPILAGAKFTAKIAETDIGFLDAISQKVNYEIDTIVNIEPLSYYRVLRLRQFGFGRLKNTNLGLHYATKVSENSANTTLGLDGGLQHQDLEIKTQATYAQSAKQNETKANWAEYSSINYEGEKFSTYFQFLNIPNDFDVSGIGFIAYKGWDFTCGGGPNFYNLGFIRSLSINSSLNSMREGGESVNSYGCNIYINSNYDNNWGNWLGFTYRRDYEQNIAYPKSNGEFGFWTDGAKPLYLTGGLWATNKEYNYRRNYFAPNGNFYLQLSWRFSPSVKTNLNINNTTEFDTIGKIEAVSWILRPSINWALTRELQLRIYSELDFDTKVHYLNLLLAWNFKPKSWVYLAFNEAHDANQTKFPLIERIGVVKVRYLFFF